MGQAPFLGVGACIGRRVSALGESNLLWLQSTTARGTARSLSEAVDRLITQARATAFFDDLFTNPAYQPYELTFDQVCRADELRFNRDPFDALSVAAQALALPLLTRDPDIRGSGVVRVIW
jgi:hypothetical protein